MTGRFLVVVGVLNFILFCVFAGAVYELRWENTELKEEISDNLLKIKQLHWSMDRRNNFMASELEETWSDFSELRRKISILEESTDPKNKRWALIKRVRSIVEDYAKPKMNIKDYTYIAGAVVDFSETHDVPISLTLAVMRRESAFNPKALSHAGAKGIMQIMSATAVDIAAEIGKRHYSLYNAKHNIQLGTYYLWKMTDRFHGDVEFAVRAYNCGPPCVEKVEAGLWSKFKCEYEEGVVVEERYPCETAEYHRKVLQYKKEFEEMGL